ncbi:Protocadherin Fat 4 [Toxocara canis]|uniref:Protocadherin Fat 4 n=1 Tax=Toxocara canis TaxID=6265 RepID=A0A0B2VDL6_TOXCA|nr:Protocadherin Fat 4 [Toxocara canis]
MAAVTYEYILTGPGATIFAVDQQGYVYLNVPSVDADPPNPSSYLLNVEAREVNTTPIRTSEPVTLTIHIMDINDNAPTFSSPVYVANVSAYGPDRPVIEIFAEDNDAGRLANIEYQITSVSNGAFGNFRYDPHSKQLMATGQLVPSQRYQVVLEARDGGGLWSQAVVLVLATGDPPPPSRNTVETFNEFPVGPAKPDFLSHPEMANSVTNEASTEAVQTFVTEISEATPPHSIVLTLGDEQTRGRAFFSITGGNEAGKFTIDENTGVIMTTGTFDRENTQMYNLQIEALSRTPPRHLYWTVVQVAVLDENDNAPEFVDPKPIELHADLSGMTELRPNIIVGRITVRDPDSQDNGRIQLRILPPMDRLFAVSADGVVTINGNLTSAHFGEHRLVFVASDHGDPPLESRADAIITVSGLKTTQPPTTRAAEQHVSVVTANGFGKLEYTTTVEERPKHWTMASFTAESLTVAPPSEGVSMLVLSQPSSTQPPFVGPERSITNYLSARTTVDTIMFMNATQFPFPPTTISSVSEATRLAPVFDPSKVAVVIDENEADAELAKLHAYYPDKMPGSITYVLAVGDPSLFSVNSYTGSIRLIRALDAEAEQSYELHITTAEASELTVDPQYAHVAVVLVKVSDVNDWIPNFELNSYVFTINSSTIPGVTIGQVTAFDQDRDEPNNKVRYRLVNANGFEDYFSVSPDNGVIALKKKVDFVDSDQKIMLTVEAADEGRPTQSSETIVVIGIERQNGEPTTESTSESSVLSPPRDALQFSLRNYTTTVSEAVRPPHLFQVLPVTNKPTDTRFIACTITSGNNRGAFGISTGNDGNCELRTQMELDREDVEHYLLNVTVASGEQSDFALVGVTVVDDNDNVPKFVFENGLSLPIYFGGVASNAPAFTRVVRVRAQDVDTGNNSEIVYSLDEDSPHSKFFSISRLGEIETKMSMAQLENVNRKSSFELKARACDSPWTGEVLCSKADIIISVIRDVHRFVVRVAGAELQQINSREKEIAKALRQFTGPCSILNIEKIEERPEKHNGQNSYDIYWYAVNPTTRRICRKREFSGLFNGETSATLTGKLRPWLKLDRIIEDVRVENEFNQHSDVFPSGFKTASVALIAIAIAIAVGALAGMCAICICYSRYKGKQRSIHSYPSVYPMPKLGTVFLPNPTLGASHDKIYETQMLELPIVDDDFTLRGGYRSSLRSVQENSTRQTYCSYGGSSSRGNGEGDFSIEESMYAVNVPGKIDPVTKRIQTLVIPAPDYPTNQKKSIL